MPIKVVSPYGHQLKTDANEIDNDVRSIMDAKDNGDEITVFILDNKDETKTVRKRIGGKNLLETSKSGHASFYAPSQKTLFIANDEYQELGDKLIRHELAHHYDLMSDSDKTIPKEERERRTREAEFGRSNLMKVIHNMFK